MPDRFASICGDTFAPALALRALGYLAESSPLARESLGACTQVFLKHLSELLVISPPMLDSLARHPEWIATLQSRVEAPEGDGGAKREFYEKAWASLTSEAHQPEDLMDQLRAFRRREYLEISYRDVAGLDSLEQTIERLSWLADCVISWTLSYCWSQLTEQQQPARLENGPEPSGFAIFAFGKLGGGELNYSSDVDLLFLREASGDEQDLRFFTRLGERLIQLLSQAGPDGFLYRVDMRLRPYGETGPLVPSLASLVTYYESWGEAWERQALIKARFVAGSKDLGRRFSDFAADFTFARQMDDSSLEEIKRVKHRAEKEYAQDRGRIHLKQGPGGVRDIEFYVQFLQLIAGRDHPEVRVRATLDAIERLGRARFLLEGEGSHLSLAYRFLRIAEHRLQLRGLTPRAVLPEEAGELALLATGLGFNQSAPVARFEAALRGHLSRVRAILERIYLTPGYLHLKEREEELAQLLSERTPRRRIRELLSQYGFQDIDKAWQNIRLLALGPAGRILPPGERRAFLGFAFTLLEVLRDSLDPDQALHRLESFAAASGNRVSFLRTLASRRPHLARLANLLAFSDLCHQVLTRHPEYFDTLAAGLHILEGRSLRDMSEELQERLARWPAGERKEDFLRKFRQREMIRIAYRDLARLADPFEISRELSDLAEACVHEAVALARSGYRDFGGVLHVVALGKFGSTRLHYASDLDLMFFYNGPEGDAAAEVRAQLQQVQDEVVEKVLYLLAGITSEGSAYQVDLRLRPEGASGLLARSWAGFMEYACHFMQPWERMALVRSRMLGEDDAAARRWNEVLVDVAYGFPWNDGALDAIRHLKRRIESEKSRESTTHLDFKYGKGGIADLEFLVQFLQLVHGRDNPPVRTPVVSDAIPALAAVGAVSEDEGRVLLAAHRFQRHVENHYQLMEEWTSREISRESPLIAGLARSLGFTPGSPAAIAKEFLATWEDHAGKVRALVEKYFYG